MTGQPTRYGDFLRLMMAVCEARERLYAHVAGGVTSRDELARYSNALEALDRVLDHGAMQGQVQRQIRAMEECRE